MSTIDEKLTLANENVPKVYAAGGAGTDLSNYVQKTDYATATTAGVVKVPVDSGIELETDGGLCVKAASDSEITARTESCRPIVPSNLNNAVKAALTDENRIDDMTDEDTAACRGIIGAVGWDDIATYNNFGIVTVTARTKGLKIGGAYNGELSVQNASYDDITLRDSQYMPITPSTLNYAVKAALSDDNRIDDMTDTEKTRARKVIDAVGFNDYASDTKAGVVYVDNGASQDLGLVIINGLLQVYSATNNWIKNRTGAAPITVENLDYAVRSVRPSVVTALPAALSVNTIYALDYVYPSLSLVLPSGEHGDFIQVDFSSGATPTNLTITSSTGLSDIDLTPEANTTYSLYFDYGIIHADDDNNLFYGWRFGYSEYPYEEV